MFKLIIISIIGSIFASMGIGGGALFIMLSIMFKVMEYKKIVVYNLILFVISSFFASVNNIQNNKIDKKIFKQSIFLCIIGCIAGISITKFLDEEKLKIYFNVFMCILGIYEIIVSLKEINCRKLTNERR